MRPLLIKLGFFSAGAIIATISCFFYFGSVLKNTNQLIETGSDAKAKVASDLIFGFSRLRSDSAYKSGNTTEAICALKTEIAQIAEFKNSIYSSNKIAQEPLNWAILNAQLAKMYKKSNMIAEYKLAANASIASFQKSNANIKTYDDMALALELFETGKREEFGARFKKTPP